LTWDITLTAQWWFLPAFSRSFPFFAPANQSQTADAAFARRLLSPESGNEWLKCLTPDQVFYSRHEQMVRGTAGANWLR
jgi:hypothetical protein